MLYGPLRHVLLPQYFPSEEEILPLPPLDAQHSRTNLLRRSHLSRCWEVRNVLNVILDNIVLQGIRDTFHRNVWAVMCLRQ